MWAVVPNAGSRLMKLNFLLLAYQLGIAIFINTAVWKSSACTRRTQFLRHSDSSPVIKWKKIILFYFCISELQKQPQRSTELGRPSALCIFLCFARFSFLFSSIFVHNRRCFGERRLISSTKRHWRRHFIYLNKF